MTNLMARSHIRLALMSLDQAEQSLREFLDCSYHEGASGYEQEASELIEDLLPIQQRVAYLSAEIHRVENADPTICRRVVDEEESPTSRDVL